MFLIGFQESVPGHVDGDGGSQYDDIAHFAEFKQVFGPVVCGGGLAGTLLPVKKGVPLLQDKIEVMFLQVGELAGFVVLIDECRVVQILRRFGVGLHIGKFPVLYVILPLFTCDEFASGFQLSDVGFGKKFRFRQCCPLQYQAVDAGRLVFHLIQQTWRIGFQFETV